MTRPGVQPLHDAVLLAGGRSSRMGQDKASLLLAGHRLWEHQIETMERTHPRRTLVSVGPTAPPGLPADLLVHDAQPNSGPLGGLAAALAASEAPLSLVMAVDVPLMTSEYLCSLLAQCREGLGCVPRFREGFEPLVAVYPREICETVQERLARKELGLQGLVAEVVERGWCRARDVGAAEEKLFANINTEADWKLLNEGYSADAGGVS